MYPPLSDIEMHSVRLADIRRDICERIWPVSRNMLHTAFESMMDDMSQLQFSSEKRAKLDGRRG